MEPAKLIAALLPHADGKPAAMMQLACLMQQDGKNEQALTLCRRALALAPSDRKLAAQACRFLSEDVPSWHFRIVGDAARNAAYDMVLRRAMRPGFRVLEIGTGTGLLAMMAARAGAAKVITCEMKPTIADLAAEIIKRNGYADRVFVVPKHSENLDVQADIGGRVDILVSEIVSNDLLGEDVLPAHEQAVRDLLRPNGQVIPACGRIRVALADDSCDEQERLGIVDGFDLSVFNRALRPAQQIKVGDARIKLCSEATDLFTFDFSSSRFCAPADATVTCRAQGGRVSGIAQWIALQMDEETTYENRPAPGGISCWAVIFHRLPHPIDTLPGQEIRIFGSHDRSRILIWSDAL